MIITNCTFQSNSATTNLAGGGGVTLYTNHGNVSITNCRFHDNSATTFSGGVSVQKFPSTIAHFRITV